LGRIPAFLPSDLLLDSSDLDRRYISHILFIAFDTITSSLALAADMHTPEKAYAAHLFGRPGKRRRREAHRIRGFSLDDELLLLEILLRDE
jgi:hypothetical protein